jgi:hypothetical protein
MLVELSARYISGAPHHPAQWTPTVRKGGRSHVHSGLTSALASSSAALSTFHAPAKLTWLLLSALKDLVHCTGLPLPASPLLYKPHPHLLLFVPQAAHKFRRP